MQQHLHFDLNEVQFFSFPSHHQMICFIAIRAFSSCHPQLLGGGGAGLPIDVSRTRLSAFKYFIAAFNFTLIAPPCMCVTCVQFCDYLMLVSSFPLSSKEFSAGAGKAALETQSTIFCNRHCIAFFPSILSSHSHSHSPAARTLHRWPFRRPSCRPKRHRRVAPSVRTHPLPPSLLYSMRHNSFSCLYPHHRSSAEQSPISKTTPPVSFAKTSSCSSRLRCSCLAPTCSTRIAYPSGLRATPRAPRAGLQCRMWIRPPLPLQAQLPRHPAISDPSTSHAFLYCASSPSCTGLSGVTCHHLLIPTSSFFSLLVAALCISNACASGRQCLEAVGCAAAPAAEQNSLARYNLTCWPLSLIRFVKISVLIRSHSYNSGTRVTPRPLPRGPTSRRRPSAAPSTSFLVRPHHQPFARF